MITDAGAEQQPLHADTRFDEGTFRCFSILKVPIIIIARIPVNRTVIVGPLFEPQVWQVPASTEPPNRSQDVPQSMEGPEGRVPLGGSVGGIAVGCKS